MYRGKPKSDRSLFTPQILNPAINLHIQSHKPTTIPGKGFEQRQATKIDKLSPSLPQSILTSIAESPTDVWH
ncbi:hypothetical protein [Nostoc sp. DedQUE09]|uniref:hypothetical protein n=1 Tax=Nostoc sp. DedQUE09 TaxID=3075394 RepID=UPI002AD492F8|nr:hypothetical protein [Nostoc sp. DedQUE09]MDZ7950603.1 hypothetical protein [Nostoc sp. DedQUE09]MDZ7954229.1 hypothetical protein [Nostoc sp. DedQUE09]